MLNTYNDGKRDICDEEIIALNWKSWRKIE